MPKKLIGKKGKRCKSPLRQGFWGKCVAQQFGALCWEQSRMASTVRSSRSVEMVRRVEIRDEDRISNVEEVVAKRKFLSDDSTDSGRPAKIARMEKDDTEMKECPKSEGKDTESVASSSGVVAGGGKDSGAGPLSKKEQQKKLNLRYRYGNFHRYYGNRLKGLDRDPRIDVFNKDWFRRRNILDIGCNAGFLTLTIAKEFEPSWILGIDIDQHLVGQARINIGQQCKGDEKIGRFPVSLITDSEAPKSRQFPQNVWFRTQNYVPQFDEELEQTQPEFDVILALSITKWIHLNWGDDGMKKFFQRAFRNLRPGGRLIVEPQDFSSYWKRAKGVDEFRDTYKTITFKPEQFKDYLLKEVGFVDFEELPIPKAASKGFERPLQVYQKEIFKDRPKAPKKVKKAPVKTDDDLKVDKDV
uniref:RNA methyltransferase n=1 Tax=Panagrellus redivivus TaxID=6233 RepID=A0A7E4ZSM0_PANRE